MCSPCVADLKYRPVLTSLRINIVLVLWHYACYVKAKVYDRFINTFVKIENGILLSNITPKHNVKYIKKYTQDDDVEVLPFVFYT